jgi:hypothetical protein
VFAARYELNSYIVFRKRLVSKRLKVNTLYRLAGLETLIAGTKKSSVLWKCDAV